MGTSSRSHHVWSQLLLFLHLSINSALAGVTIEQTIPENDALVCPGQELTYTCFSNEGSIGWIIGSDLVSYGQMDSVNSSKNIQGFETVLTLNNGSIFISTATNPMVTFAYNGTMIVCLGDNSIDSGTIVLEDSLSCAPAGLQSTSARLFPTTFAPFFPTTSLTNEPNASSINFVTESPTGDRMLGLIIGLTVGLGVFGIIAMIVSAVLIVLCWRQHSERVSRKYVPPLGPGKRIPVEKIAILKKWYEASEDQNVPSTRSEYEHDNERAADNKWAAKEMRCPENESTAMNKCAADEKRAPEERYTEKSSSLAANEDSKKVEIGAETELLCVSSV